MAHFAKIENNIVTQVLVVPDNQEHRGQDYLANDLGLGGTWIKTSYNTYGNVHKTGETPLRKNYASVGYEYDSHWDAFRQPKPFPSWKLNYETFLWEAPISKPEEEEGYFWRWAEINQEWIKIAK